MLEVWISSDFFSQIGRYLSKHQEIYEFPGSGILPPDKSSRSKSFHALRLHFPKLIEARSTIVIHCFGGFHHSPLFAMLLTVSTSTPGSPRHWSTWRGHSSRWHGAATEPRPGAEARGWWLICKRQRPRESGCGASSWTSWEPNWCIWPKLRNHVGSKWRHPIREGLEGYFNPDVADLRSCNVLNSGSGIIVMGLQGGPPASYI